MTAPDTVRSEISIPTKGFDLLYFEVVRGRACDSLQSVQGIEINKLTAQLVHQGTAIVVRDGKITDLEATIKLLQERGGADKELMQAKNERLKIRLRKLWRIVVIEGGIVVVLVILLI